MKSMRPWLVPLLAAALVACNAAPVRPSAAPAAAVAHDNLNATLWMQTAAEYEANVRGVYAAALASLDDALQDPAWNALPEGERNDGFESRPPAIIVDADETMIDNSPFQARGVREGSEFAYERWLAWVNERRARALPGAVEFANAVSARGVTIYFVTNRDAPAETESTIANLRALGFPILADASNVMLRGDVRAPAREKSERRRWVSARHRVLLLLGDNLGDFIDAVGGGVAERQANALPFAAWWGRRWFMLPNPTYGSWESALLRACEAPERVTPVECKRKSLRFD